jgi:hypothetical protein
VEAKVNDITAALERERSKSDWEGADALEWAIRTIRGDSGAKVAPAWTKEPPKQPGHWWRRIDAEEKPEAVEVYFLDGIGLRCNGCPPSDCGGEWWPVPIAEPPA